MRTVCRPMGWGTRSGRRWSQASNSSPWADVDLALNQRRDVGAPGSPGFARGNLVADNTGSSIPKWQAPKASTIGTATRGSDRMPPFKGSADHSPSRSRPLAVVIASHLESGETFAPPITRSMARAGQEIRKEIHHAVTTRTDHRCETSRRDQTLLAAQRGSAASGKARAGSSPRWRSRHFIRSPMLRAWNPGQLPRQAAPVSFPTGRSSSPLGNCDAAALRVGVPTCCGRGSRIAGRPPEAMIG